MAGGAGGGRGTPRGRAPLDPLPVDAVLPQLVAALREHPAAVLRAPTGAGKTTRVPPALLDAGLADLADGPGQVVVLEPRRVAARAAARRMAEERGGELGDEVGYRLRFEQAAGPRTRILVVTEGLLVRMLQTDPFLEKVGAVVFDEFHERSLDTDLALALVRKVQREVRPGLRLVVMSATIAACEIAAWLGDAPVVESEGRLFPVAIEHLEREPERTARLAEGLDARVADGVRRVFAATGGDVLAFLPGTGEIRAARAALEPWAARSGIALLELYGDLPSAEQDAALRRGPDASAGRRIVLATNVAETSVTVEGVTGVVDSGLARVLRFDPGVGLDRLELERIARDSADQRAGRAGRTAPGVALRLWTQTAERSLAERTEPEIRRVDLAGAALTLLDFGETDLSAFPWFERPSDAALDEALRLLERLGAVDARGITATGRRLARVPAHPRIARLLHAGHALGCLREAALAGALLAERDPFPRTPRGSAGARPAAGSNRHVSDSDLADRVRALEAFADGGRGASPLGAPASGPARFVLRAAEQLERTAERAFGKPGPDADDRTGLLRAVLQAWPDRVARRRAPGDATDRRAVMVGGRGVRLADESAVTDDELFVCCALDAGRRGERAEGLVRIASGIERAWLPPERITTADEVVYDRARERVVAVRRTRYEDLVLDEAPTGAIDDELAARALVEAVGEDLGRIVPFADPELSGFLARVRSLAAWMPELELPALDGAWLRAELASLIHGARTLDEARRRDWPALLAGRLDHRRRTALEREAPERLAVPTGSKIKLDYAEGRAPALAVRIQEVFGLKETPRIAGGRVAVVLHLLAPNYRPQQITEDLESFWNGAYQQVRKELRARYPKHAWPEDPWNAPPVRKGPSGRR